MGAPTAHLGYGVASALLQPRTGPLSARSNTTICYWYSHRQASAVLPVFLISPLMSPTIYWLISNLLPTNMQMSDKHRFSASVIIPLMYKPLSSLSRFFCVCVHASGISLFLEAGSVHFYALIKEFSDYCILKYVYIYMHFPPQFQICQIIFFA